MTVLDAFVGRRHIVLLTQPTEGNDQLVMQQQPDQPRTFFRLLAYARYPSQPGKDNESGKLEQDPPVKNPAGIDPHWQPVEGGFYYRSADRKAHFLKGSGSVQPAAAPGGAGAPPPAAGVEKL